MLTEWWTDNRVEFLVFAGAGCLSLLALGFWWAAVVLWRRVRARRRVPDQLRGGR